MSHRYIIDCETKNVKRNISALKKLKSTLQVENGGMYHQDKHYSQIHLVSSKPLPDIEKWFYEHKGVEAIGVVGEGS